MESSRVRNKIIKIRVSEEELKQLENKKAKNHLAQWMREFCLNPNKCTPQPTRETDPELIRQFAAIGNNLNQIARKANEGSFSSPIGVIQELRLIKEAMIRVGEIHKKR